MIQTVHLFLIMFTWDVPLMLVKPGSQSLQQHEVTKKVHLMMDPTRIHTSPLSSNQQAKQPWASRTFNPNQISVLVFKKINQDDAKDLPVSQDVHQVFTEGYLSVAKT